MAVTKSIFGRGKNGVDVTMFSIENSHGAKVQVLDYGCTIHSILVPDKTGKLIDVCLGYDTMEAYEKGNAYFGAVIGRYANRIGEAKFTLDETLYTLHANDGKNHLHGGLKGFDKWIWQAKEITDGVCFTRVSPDMEEGYPGELKVNVIITFNDAYELKIHYEAHTNKKTVVNLTNHTYFNLTGAGNGSIAQHLVKINAKQFLANDEGCLPTGEILDVVGTAFDLQEYTNIDKGLSSGDAQIQVAGGYDHCFLCEGYGIQRAVAYVYAPETGIAMSVATDLPGIQFYSGNFMDHIKGKDGKIYDKQEGFCLETEFLPNFQQFSGFPTPVLDAGECLKTETVYRFSVGEM